MATKKTAKTTSLVKWDEKFSKYAKEAKDQVANIGTSGLSVKFGRGSISIGDTPVKGGALECIIIGHCALNRWNEAMYDADNKQPPDCYAFSLISDDPDMAPHPAATNKQADKCADCDKNVFGTAITGKGKACSNTIRLGLITAKDAEDAASISGAELASAGVSPTNLTRFKKYLDAVLEDNGRPLWAVITEITSHDDPKTQIRLEFKLVDVIEDNDVIEALEKRFLKVQDVLQKPFAAPTERKSVGKKAAGGSKKFAAAGKKAAGKR